MVRRINSKSGASFEIRSARTCFPMTVNRLPYNRPPTLFPIASHGAIPFSMKKYIAPFPVELSMPVNGYTVSG